MSKRNAESGNDWLEREIHEGLRDIPAQVRERLGVADPWALRVLRACEPLIRACIEGTPAVELKAISLIMLRTLANLEKPVTGSSRNIITDLCVSACRPLLGLHGKAPAPEKQARYKRQALHALAVLKDIGQTITAKQLDAALKGLHTTLDELTALEPKLLGKANELVA